MDRWPWHHCWSVLGRGPDSLSAARPKARTPWSGGAASLWRIRTGGALRDRARRHRDGATLARRARGRRRARHSHFPRIDGESAHDVADPARHLSLEKNSLRRSRRGTGSNDPRPRAIAGVESKRGLSGFGRALRFEDRTRGRIERSTGSSSAKCDLGDQSNHSTAVIGLIPPTAGIGLTASPYSGLAL